MTARNIVLTGVPRAGTTLSCRLLGQASDTVALFEPIRISGLSRVGAEALDQIAAFFEASRGSLSAHGTAWSQQVAGQVPDNPISSRTDALGRRRHESERGCIRIDKPLSAGFNLVVKHNAAFTALLPGLAARFEAWAIVRNPLAVLASWHSVDLPVTHGRLPAGERFDRALAARLDAEPDLLERQLLILDWLFSQYARHLPAERVLAYEDIVATAGGRLADAVGVEMPRLPLQERNASSLYDPAHCRRLAARLLDRTQAPWRAHYGADDIASLLARMQEGAA